LHVATAVGDDVDAFLPVARQIRGGRVCRADGTEM
jgi:hypothetical protein